MAHPMTTHGYNLINDELEGLIKNDREEVKNAIAEAREHGDLKENAEYHAAKERQSHIEGRIGVLQAKLAGAQVIEPSTIKNDKIVFGAYISILHVENENTLHIQLVGEDEAQSGQNKISYLSPLGKALIGKEEGDEVVVKAPKGDVHYEIEEVEYK